MALTINTNIAAMTAQRSLGGAQSSLATAVQRLSSGLRINSARDDAAGLAISERFTTQIRGMNQAVRNANDGISMLQTAEGSLASITGQLQRIRELAVQAANATNSASDRQALQAEVTQLSDEIERSASTATFNGLSIFDRGRGSMVGDPNLLALKDALTGVGGWLENSEKMIEQYFGIKASGSTVLDIKYYTDAAGGTLAYVATGSPLSMNMDLADFQPVVLPNGGSGPLYADRVIAHEMVHAVMADTMNIGGLPLWLVEGTAEFINGGDERMSGYGSIAVAAESMRTADLDFNAGTGDPDVSRDYAAGYAMVRFLHYTSKAAGGEGIKDVMTALSSGKTLDQAISLATGGDGTSGGTYNTALAFKTAFQTDNGVGETFMNANINLANSDTGAVGGLDADGGSIKTAESVVPNIASRSGEDVLEGFVENFFDVPVANGGATQLAFQIGANVGETITTSLGAMNLDALALMNSLDVVDNPLTTINAIDRALDYVSGQRARIGAQLSRFEAAVQNMQAASENMSASRSRIMDADFATETAQLSRAQILQSAGMAMVAQANTMPANVLQLLSA